MGLPDFCCRFCCSGGLLGFAGPSTCPRAETTNKALAIKPGRENFRKRTLDDWRITFNTTPCYVVTRQAAAAGSSLKTKTFYHWPLPMQVVAASNGYY